MGYQVAKKPWLKLKLLWGFRKVDAQILSLIVACSAGAYASFSFTKGTETRIQLFNLFTACVIMGAAMTVIVFGLLEHFQPKMVISDTFRAGVGALVSFIGRYLLPWMAETFRSGAWVNWLPFVQKNKE